MEPGEELIGSRLWPQTIVMSDHGINKQSKSANREELGASSEHPRLIETVDRRRIPFGPDVAVVSDGQPESCG